MAAAHTAQGCFHRDSAVKQFLGAASSFEPFWDVAVQFGNDFVNGFLPGRVSILACPDGTEELLKCQAGHLQEPPWHLQQDRHQPVTVPCHDSFLPLQTPLPPPPDPTPHLEVIPLVIVHVEGSEEL